MVNLSVGGLQLRSAGSFAYLVRAGMEVAIDNEAEGRTRGYNGRVAWVAASDAGDRFGIELVGLSDDDKAVLERLRSGQAEPQHVALVLRA